ncbi:MAG: tripartite tricarboxylate transporter substrate binding protein [Betaproteobacteria bacterium]|nr:tripartite tricarboxylate transporter substrate binding protein [Betaproteobacteria bacterium]
MVVPTGPGSSLDLIVRATSDRLSARLGQPIVVDNKPGAAGLIGTDAVAKASDGHTFGISFNGPLAFAPFLYQKMPYRLPDDFAPIVMTTSQPNVLAVNARLPVQSVAELVQWLRANVGKASFASIGNGSSSHLSMELLKVATGTFALHIPYNGSPPSALSVATGETQMIMTVAPALLPHVQAGRVRLLAVTSRTRYQPLPDLPTIAESGLPELKDFEAIAWNAIVGPASTPTPVVERLNREWNDALQDPAISERLIGQGMTPTGGSPQVLARLMADEAARWGPVIRRTGITLG